MRCWVGHETIEVQGELVFCPLHELPQFFDWLGQEYGACEVADLPDLPALVAQWRDSTSAKGTDGK
jgi:hypothetical protein